MSTLSSFKHRLFTVGANGKKVPTEAVRHARQKDFKQSEYYKAVLRREERQRRDGERSRAVIEE